jgi:hypothetical protein
LEVRVKRDKPRLVEIPTWACVADSDDWLIGKGARELVGAR